MSRNLSRFVKNITIEPAFFLYTAIYVILDLTYVNLLVQKSCRFKVQSEPDLNTPCDDERRGITFANEMSMYYRFVIIFLNLILATLAMCWSDEAGRRRRPLIFLPIIGLIFQSLSGCLHSYFWTWNATYAILSNASLVVISGGIPMMILASTAYICDVSDVKSRTMRLGFYSAASTFGDLSGYGCSGFILHSFGFFYTYLICFALSVLALVMALIFVKDVSIPSQKERHFWQFFLPTRIVDSFKIVFKQSLGSKRILVVILLTIRTSIYFSTQGESSVQYLFLRYKFHWNERDYSLYVIYRYIGVILGSIFGATVMSKWLKLHDGLIGAFAALWDTMAAFGYLFANQTWHLYVVSLLDIFHGITLSVCLSFLSKFYEIDEFGRLSAVLGITKCIVPLCFPAYNGIFQNTMDFFPSAYFMLSIAIYTSTAILYVSSYFLSKKLQKMEKTPKEERSMINVR